MQIEIGFVCPIEIHLIKYLSFLPMLCAFAIIWRTSSSLPAFCARTGVTICEGENSSAQHCSHYHGGLWGLTHMCDVCALFEAHQLASVSKSHKLWYQTAGPGILPVTLLTLSSGWFSSGKLWYAFLHTSEAWWTTHIFIQAWFNQAYFQFAHV